MATESILRIGKTYLGGTPRHVGDSQASLFNSSDLIALGKITDDSFLRAYRISVRELRRRLEVLGYSLDHVCKDIVATLKKGYEELEDDDPPECKSFLDYGCAVTSAQLIELVQQWKDTERYDYMAQFDLDNFSDALLNFIQGSSSEFLIPSEKIWLHGFHFERLLCEVHSDDDSFEIDFTDLIHAGYYSPDDQPITDDFDQALAKFNPLSYRLMEKLIEEESETLEFKSISSGNPSKAITQALPKYLIGFLNGKGGRILYGVTDDGIVEGININREQRDELQRLIVGAISSITPSFPQNDVQLRLRPLISVGVEIPDKFVVDISLSSGNPNEMYFNQRGETWVRHGTSTCSLTGHALFAHIRSRYR